MRHEKDIALQDYDRVKMRSDLEATKQTQKYEEKLNKMAKLQKMQATHNSLD